MKIVYIHQYFKTPKEPGSTRSYHIIQELMNAGHVITVIGSKRDGQIEPVLRKCVDGIDVISISNYYSGKQNLKGRIKSFLRFMWKSTYYLFQEKGVDLVIATSTPLTIGVPPLLFKWVKGVPYIFEVRDLWPEVPIQMGALNSPVLRWAALFFERLIYKNAWHIVALSPGMQSGVVKVLGSSTNVSMIPNMAKKESFWKRPKNLRLQSDLGVRDDSFKIIHFGAMGKANGLQYILDAAQLLKEGKHEDLEFIFLGDGSEKEKLVSFCKEKELHNVFFFGRTAMDKTSEIINLCDVSVVTFKNIPILYTNSPNKFFDSLSAGIPIIVNSKGWTKDIVETFHCGAYVSPDDPQALANTLLDWQKQPELLAQYGSNGRKLAEEKYDISILCKDFVDIVATFKPGS